MDGLLRPLLDSVDRLLKGNYINLQLQDPKVTSTDVLPRKPKSCSLNGSPSKLSAVSRRY